MSAPVEFHPRLVEQAVWAALPGRSDAGVFHRERERLYDEADPAERERRFDRLHAAWFERLDLAQPVRLALGEHVEALALARRVVFAPVDGSGREGAELFVASPGEFSVVVTLRPSTLAASGPVLVLLRRELAHIADMLDPAFAYEPRLPEQPLGPAHDRRLLERYSALWNASVDGRLVRLGRLAPRIRDERLQEFEASFLCLGIETEACFERIFSGSRPSHPDIVRVAYDPEAGFGLRAPSCADGGRCALCGFPTVTLEPDPAGLPDEVRRAIGADFPAWRPDRGICPQCAELYRCRALARVEG